MSQTPMGARPRLIVISGRPGSGKSTLARRLAAEDALWLPLIANDPLRVGMLDALGVVAGDPAVTVATRGHMRLYACGSRPWQDKTPPAATGILRPTLM